MARMKNAVGAYGERVAVDHLTRSGMTVIDRNWRCSAGEIDAILRDGETIVFAEVKTRRGDAFGTPAEAIGRAKQARLRRLAAIWLAQSQQRSPEIRFDVISVRPNPAGAAAVEHVRAAF